MGHCPCFRWKKGNKLKIEKDRELAPTQTTFNIPDGSNIELETAKEIILDQSTPGGISGVKIHAKIFNYRELAAATNNFRSESLIGEGGFGPVYRGKLQGTGQDVAVKVLNQTGLQGDREFLVEALMLSLVHHPNLVNMVGYCAEGDQRILVYEHMPLGSLESHLYDLKPDMVPLDFKTRIKIAAGAANGLAYLHTQANPPVIYRDLKSANILLGEGFQPKLSDFGLAKFGPQGDKSHVSTRVMGTYGYCAPDYALTGKLTTRSDIYSFGVVLLELMTGRRAFDSGRGRGKEAIVEWASPVLKDPKKCLLIADPNMGDNISEFVYYKILELASFCVREEPRKRPLVADVVKALDYLVSKMGEPGTSPPRSPSSHEGNPTQHKDGEVDESEKTLDRTLKLNKDLDRAQAVAEAKIWGETYRDKRRQNAGNENLDR